MVAAYGGTFGGCFLWRGWICGFYGSFLGSLGVVLVEGVFDLVLFGICCGGLLAALEAWWGGGVPVRFVSCFDLRGCA